MKKVISGALASLLCLFLAAPSWAADEPSELNVAYFQGWPTPNQFAQIKGAYDLALGLKVNWIPFRNGSEMNEALASGQVQIAFSQGHTPFMVAVTSGLHLTAVGIAVSYPEFDKCIVRDGSDINRNNAKSLEGQKVATPIGSPTHYRLLKVLEHLKVDVNRVQLVPMNSGSAANRALESGEVAMACHYGTQLRKLETLGSPLMTGAEQQEIGLKMFDLIVVSTEFLEENPELVQGFIDVTNASNEQWKLNPGPMRAAIARAAHMDPAATNRTIAEFQFPSADEQKSG
ncbi:MAG: ABC transporter substrate-binding protein [Pseudomonadota bacterium]